MKFSRLRASLHQRCAVMYWRLADDRAGRARYHDGRARLLGYPRRRAAR